MQRLTSGRIDQAWDLRLLASQPGKATCVNLKRIACIYCVQPTLIACIVSSKTVNRREWADIMLGGVSPFIPSFSISAASSCATTPRI